MQFCVYFTVSLGKNAAMLSEGSSPAPLNPSLTTAQFSPEMSAFSHFPPLNSLFNYSSQLDPLSPTNSCGAGRHTLLQPVKLSITDG